MTDAPTPCRLSRSALAHALRSSATVCGNRDCPHHRAHAELLEAAAEALENLEQNPPLRLQPAKA